MVASKPPTTGFYTYLPVSRRKFFNKVLVILASFSAKTVSSSSTQMIALSLLKRILALTNFSPTIA
jgi:hypothetical protein